jgi:hypothetical protein
MAFEYEVYSTAWGHGMSTEPIKKELNKRGAAGWELIGMTRDESPVDEHDEEVVMFVFKREARGKVSNGGGGKKKSKKKK